MKYPLLTIGTIVLALFLIQACGPSEEELQQQEQARLDSLEQVRADSIARARADSIARAQEEERLAAQRERERQEQERRNVVYSDNGRFTLQVEAWRTLEYAQAGLEQWQNRGFDKAYLVEYREDDNGELWYRLRIGRFASQEMAERQQHVLEEDFNQHTWIDNYRELPRVTDNRVRERS